MKNEIWLIRDPQLAESVAIQLKQANIPFATVEAEYGDVAIEGTHATLAHHTLEYRHYPAPCVRTDVSPLENGVILISHLDLDTLGGIALLENRYFTHSFWESEAIIDTQGVLGHDLIPSTDADLMKIYWAWEKTLIEPPRNAILTSVTQQVEVRLAFIEELLLNQLPIESQTHYLTLFENDLLQFESTCVWEAPQLRVFVSSEPQHYLTHYREGQLIESCITWNPLRGTLILSDISKQLDCKEFMQQHFGPKAGGQYRVAGTPRDEQLNGFALIYLIQALIDIKKWKIEPFHFEK